jgi:hypothetical protein
MKDLPVFDLDDMDDIQSNGYLPIMFYVKDNRSTDIVLVPVGKNIIAYRHCGYSDGNKVFMISE